MSRFGYVTLDPLLEPAPLSAEDQHRIRMLWALPPNHRIALVLVAGQEWSYADVAQLLDCPAATVGLLVYEAREALRIAALPMHTPAPQTSLIMEDSL